jgi:hypothetical protein
MTLVDPSGKKLTGRSKEEVEDILLKLAPKNKEQEQILAKAIGERIEKIRKEKMARGLKNDFDGVFERNAKMRASRGDGFSKSRDWRLEAIIPREMYYVAKKVWGDDVITNPVKFKEAFVKDEQGRLCLTVDPDTI